MTVLQALISCYRRGYRLRFTRSDPKQGEWVYWVRLKGPVCDLFVVAVYMSHKGRVSPDQNQTLEDIRKVLADIPARDCICLLGDFN